MFLFYIQQIAYETNEKSVWHSSDKEQTGESADCEESPFPLRNMRGSAHPAAWIRDERMLLARHVATQRAILHMVFSHSLGCSLRCFLISSTKVNILECSRLLDKNTITGFDVSILHAYYETVGHAILNTANGMTVWRPKRTCRLLYT